MCRRFDPGLGHQILLKSEISPIFLFYSSRASIPAAQAAEYLVYCLAMRFLHEYRTSDNERSVARGGATFQDWKRILPFGSHEVLMCRPSRGGALIESIAI